MGAEGAIMLAPEIVANEALVSVNILNNDIGAEQARNFVAILNKHNTLKSLCGNKGDETELDMSGKKMGAEGAIMLAPEIVANGTVTSLDLSSNKLVSLELPEGWSGPNGKGYFCRNHKAIQDDPPEGATRIMDGIIAIGNAIRQMQRLVTVNLLNNQIEDIEKAQELADILKEHPTLKSLCGNKGNEAELDMSGKDMDADDAIMLVPEITTNLTLRKLIFGGDGRIKVPHTDRLVRPKPATLEVGNIHEDLSDKNLQAAGAIIVAAWISHKDKGKLTSLNLSNNNIKGVYADYAGKCLIDALKPNTTLTNLIIEGNRIERWGFWAMKTGNWHHLTRWKRRWFQCNTPDSGTITYWLSQDMTGNPQGTIRVKSIADDTSKIPTEVMVTDISGRVYHLKPDPKNEWDLEKLKQFPPIEVV